MSYARGDAMVKGFSGTDRAESELYFGASRVYTAIALGMGVEEAIAKEDKRWREYAAEAQKKVADAPKIKMGPYSGASWVHHRWVGLDQFEVEARHIRQAVRAIEDE